jgi:hypothetical protein
MTDSDSPDPAYDLPPPEDWEELPDDQRGAWLDGFREGQRAAEDSQQAPQAEASPTLSVTRGSLGKAVLVVLLALGMAVVLILGLVAL